jgi:hypothetical protein
MKVGIIGRDDMECEGGEGEKNECPLTVATFTGPSIWAIKKPTDSE